MLNGLARNGPKTMQTQSVKMHLGWLVAHLLMIVPRLPFTRQILRLQGVRSSSDVSEGRKPGRGSFECVLSIHIILTRSPLPGHYALARRRSEKLMLTNQALHAGLVAFRPGRSVPKVKNRAG
jgi:hypothetical protein